MHKHKLTKRDKQYYIDNPESNYPLIDKILRKYTHPNLLPDVRQQAMLLVLENRHKYDPARGEYSTFVGMYTYNALKQVMNEFSTPVRVPICKKDKETGRTVTQKAIEYSGVSLDAAPSSSDESFENWFADNIIKDLDQGPEEEIDLKTIVEKIYNEVLDAPVTRKMHLEHLFFRSHEQKRKVLSLIKGLMETRHSINKVANELNIDRSSIYKVYMHKIKQATANVVQREDVPLA